MGIQPVHTPEINNWIRYENNKQNPDEIKQYGTKIWSNTNNSKHTHMYQYKTSLHTINKQLNPILQQQTKPSWNQIEGNKNKIINQKNTNIHMKIYTGRGHDDELIRFGNGLVMDLDGDAATSPRDPTQIVELTAELRNQGLCFSHWVALQVRLWGCGHFNSVRSYYFRRSCRRCCWFQVERERAVAALAETPRWMILSPVQGIFDGEVILFSSCEWNWEGDWATWHAMPLCC